MRHMWGMTELSPLGSVNTLKGAQVDMELTPQEQLNVKVSIGVLPTLIVTRNG